MEITIKAEPKEIAALVVALQERKNLKYKVCNTGDIEKTNGITVDLTNHGIPQAKE